jgi:tetratricopeptide (TPR) repeat protein
MTLEKNLPKRSRSHQLQEEHKRAFQDKLPLEWVCEFIPQENDYCLDGRIEVFDCDGYATGKMFFFQLKATDQRNLNKALACKFDIEKLEYYRLLDLPVLIVRYHSPTQKMYVKWFHTYDPYYGKNAEKQFTFRLSEKDEWQEQTVVELIANLEGFIILRSSSFKSPVNLSLNCEEEIIRGLLSIEVEIELLKTVEKINRLVSINPSYSSNKDTHGVITLREKNIEIYLLSGTGFTLHNYEIDQKTSLAVLCHDILMGIAVALEKTGQSNIAAKIIAEIAPYSSIIAHSEILLIVIHSMAHAHRVIEALHLAEKLMDIGDFVVASQQLMLVAQTQRDQLLENEKVALQYFLKKCIAEALKKEDTQIIAVAHYNYSNYLRSKQFEFKKDLRLVLHHYRKAAKYDMRYWDKSYFYRELAGVLFESQRYTLSAKLYECALNLGEEGVCLALYADALMFVGEYHLALQAFKKYFESNIECEPEYRLKAFALEKICSMFKIEKQKRKTKKALQLSAREQNLSPSEYRGKLQESLNHDVLCSNAWFNLGVLELTLEHQESSLFSFLFAAIINKSDLEAWCNTIGLGLFTNQCLLLQDMIYVAIQNHRNNFMTQMIKVVQNQSHNFPKKKIINSLYEISGQVQSRKEKLTVRHNSH